jgi:hypothetical protein
MTEIKDKDKTQGKGVKTVGGKEQKKIETGTKILDGRRGEKGTEILSRRGKEN